MKAIWKGESNPLGLIHGKEYEVLDVCWNNTMFSVVDETGIDYLYAAEGFEIVPENKA